MDKKFDRKKSKVSSIGPGPQRSTIKEAADALESVSPAEIKHLSNISNNVFDSCCFVIVCPTHNRILLTRGNCVFFPFVPLTPCRTWYDSSIEGALGILLGQGNDSKVAMLKANLPFKKFICMHIFRFQLPQSQRFVTRLIYLAMLQANETVICCRNTTGCKWFPVEDAVSSRICNVWGPEVSYFTNIAASNKPIVNTIVEFSLNDAFKYIPREQPLSYEEQMLNYSNITINDIERLYADFIEHCFPSFFFTRDSFQVFMQKHDIEVNTRTIHRYYTAFRFRSKQYMQFHELLLGLAAIDSRTPHGDARIKLVFRYLAKQNLNYFYIGISTLFRFYDYDKDGFLNYKEFKRLYKDLMLKTASQKSPDRNAKTEMKRIGAINANGEDLISMEMFVQAVGNHVFRGTSKLCRVAVPPFGQITRSLATRKICKVVNKSNLNQVLQNVWYDGKCNGCSISAYEISTRCVLLNENGCPIKYTEINITRKIPSGTNFKSDAGLHFLLSQIRQFNQKKGTIKNFKGLFYNAPIQQIQSFYNDLKEICIEVSKLLEKEERALRINGQTYVIGDIHGNLEDLLTLEQCLWKNMPLLTANFLFLGDYVDRGRWGFECFLYLMIMKLMLPNKVYLLRGNHEIRCIQLKYSFHKELLKKYGNNYGQRIFELYNYVFDRLPFCAVVNESIYCAHGGIPYSAQTIEQLNQMPVCIQDPEIEAATVWEILWTDPLEYNKFGETAEVLNIPINAFNGAYLPNIKRGTSYVFNEYAASAFLKVNRLKYIIRAHEVPASGYKFNFGTLCTTVFSCSHYCGADNECAVVYIDRDGRLRIVRIDTSNNSPATNIN